MRLETSMAECDLIDGGNSYYADTERRIGYRSERLLHNPLQAQRDYFGAHTYERFDEEGTFRSEWLRLRRGPKVVSG